ncbi:putative oxidoreductase, partial [Lachnellula suecica]
MAPLVWLVTGCSSGFGAQFITEILSRGDKAIATSRDPARLASLADAGASVLQLDVTAPQAEIDAQMQKAVSVYGHIDVLINNAGFVALGGVEETTQEELQTQLATNLFGPINVTRALLPHFRSRRAGKVAFTSSIFSWYSQPCASPYAISKHGLTAYAQTLALETASLGIQVTTFDIGHFRTKVGSPGNLKVYVPKIADYEDLKAQVEGMIGGVDGNQPGDPVKGVKVMVDVLTGEKKMPLRVP